MVLLVLYLFCWHVGLRCMFWVVEKRHYILHSSLLVSTAVKRKFALFSWYGLISSFSLVFLLHLGHLSVLQTLVCFLLLLSWTAQQVTFVTFCVPCYSNFMVSSVWFFFFLNYFILNILFYFFTSVNLSQSIFYSWTQANFLGGYFPASNNLFCPAV